MNLLKHILNALSNYLAEPVSSLSDLLLAVIAFILYRRIRSYKKLKISEKDWARFFLFLAYSTFCGGLAHAIFNRESNPVYDIIWLLMQLFSGIAVYYALSAAIHSEIKYTRQQNLFRKAAYLQLLIFLPSVLYFSDFKVVAVNSFIAIVALLIIYLFSKQSTWLHRALITSGFLISVIAVYVNHTKNSLAPWFNHNDLSHVIMFLSLLLIYKGVKYKLSEYSLFKTNGNENSHSKNDKI